MSKGRGTCEQFVDGTTEGIEVGPGAKVAKVSVELFGGHIGGCPHDET